MLPIIVRRKATPANSLAWLAIVFFQPWVGLVLYGLIGSERLGRKRLRWRAKMSQFLEVHRYKHTDDSKPHQIANEQSILISLASWVGGMPVVDGNTLQLVSDTTTTIDRLSDDIDSALHHVHLLFYIVRNDDIGRQVANALIRARGRGVECRLLMDAVGSRGTLKALGRELLSHGVKVNESLPVNVFRRRLGRLDLRNHRKLAVIDGTVAWTGSQNLVNANYGHRNLGEWRDLMARLTGPAVREMQVIFCEDWFYETQQQLLGDAYFPKPESKGSVGLQVVPSGPDQPTEDFQHLIVEAIHSAQEQVTITSPYFVPDEPLLLALRLSARRGVKVSVILAEKTDHPIVDAVRAYYCPEVMEYGVEVSYFGDGLLHAKTLTVDNTFGMFGSANFDIRSFRLNFELNVAIYDQHAIQELCWVQQQYKSASRIVTMDEWANRSWLRRFGTDLAKLASPLL